MKRTADEILDDARAALELTKRVNRRGALAMLRFALMTSDQPDGPRPGPDLIPVVGVASTLLEDAKRTAPDALAGEVDDGRSALRWLCAEIFDRYRGLLTLTPRAGVDGAMWSVLRSLIECVAQVQWVVDAVGDDGAASRTLRTRALCLELGVKVAQRDSMRVQRDAVGVLMAQPGIERLPRLAGLDTAVLQALQLDDGPGVTASDVLASIREFTGRAAEGADMTAVRDRHAATGCRCRGRRWGQAQQTLKRSNHLMGPFWQLTWSLGASVDHALAPIAYELSVDPSFALILTRVRFQMLMVATQALVDGTARSVGAFDRERAARFLERVAVLQASPAWTAAMTEVYFSPPRSL